MGCAGALSGNDAAGDASLYSVAKHSEIVGATDVDTPQVIATMCHRMWAHCDTRSGVVGNHALFGIHGLQRRSLLFVLIQRFQERPCLPPRLLNLPERIATVRTFAKSSSAHQSRRVWRDQHERAMPPGARVLRWKRRHVAPLPPQVPKRRSLEGHGQSKGRDAAKADRLLHAPTYTAGPTATRRWAHSEALALRVLALFTRSIYTLFIRNLGPESEYVFGDATWPNAFSVASLYFSH